MTAYAITTGLNATTSYTNYGFDSFCRGPDGTMYGIKSDGLYVLAGESDNSSNIAASAAFGKLNFGTSQFKRCPNVYLSVDSPKPMVVTVNGYSYETRSSDADMMTQRADVGKGIRANFLEVSVANKLGADFNLESVEVLAAATSRRI